MRGMMGQELKVKPQIIEFSSVLKYFQRKQRSVEETGKKAKPEDLPCVGNIKVDMFNVYRAF